MEAEEYQGNHWNLAQYMRDTAQFSSVVQDHTVQNTMSEKNEKEGGGGGKQMSKSQ